jgi:hypothetical protein
MEGWLRAVWRRLSGRGIVLQLVRWLMLVVLLVVGLGACVAGFFAARAG